MLLDLTLAAERGQKERADVKAAAPKLTGKALREQREADKKKGKEEAEAAYASSSFWSS